MRTWQATAWLSVAIASVMMACVGDEPDLDRESLDAGTDAGASDSAADGAEEEEADAPGRPCNLGAPLGAPRIVPGLESAGDESGPALSPNELEIYFTRVPPQQNYRQAAIFRARRTSLRAAFGDVTSFLDRPNEFDSDPYLSSDGRSFFVVLGDSNGADIYLRQQDGNVIPVDGVNSAANDGQPFLSADGKELWFARESVDRADGGSRSGIFRARYSAGSASGAEPVAELNLASSKDGWPVLSPDLRTVYFASTRSDVVPAGSGQNIWVARRADPAGPFDTPQPVAGLNSQGDDAPRWLSPDGCRLYLTSDRGGDKAIYMAERPR